MLVNRTPSIWPVKGRITSSFGRREDPFSGKGVFHPGIDIASTYGVPVVATADGYVVFAEWDGGLGHCVKILHGRNGYRTVYGHLKEYFVREGPARTARRSDRAARQFRSDDRQACALRSALRRAEGQSLQVPPEQGTHLRGVAGRLNRVPGNASAPIPHKDAVPGPNGSPDRRRGRPAVLATPQCSRNCQRS